MSEINNKKTIRTFLESVWNNGDFSQLENFVIPKYEIRSDPGDPWEGQILNYSIFKERVLYSRRAFPDLRFDIKDMLEEANKVLVSWIMSGTHKGDLPQLPATGKRFLISGMTIYYFEKGKLCGHTQSYDRLGFLEQIGFRSK